MPDLDAYYAGGSTGTMARAAQLAALQASNAARLAASLLRTPVKQARPEAARPAPAKPFTIPPTPLPAGQLPPNYPGSQRQDLTATFDLVETLARLRGEPRPSSVGRVSEMRDWLSTVPGATAPREYPKPPPPVSRPLSKGMQLQHEEVAQRLQTTIGQMGNELARDPLPNERTAIAKELLASIRKDIHAKLYDTRELMANPLVRAANDEAARSELRRKQATFKNINTKVQGDEAYLGDTDGTFASMVEERDVAEIGRDRKLSEVLNQGNLPPYVLARDENGFLHVTKADDWLSAKFTEMHKDPHFAAQVITALSMSTLYGDDTKANKAANRVMQDAEGNPVKAIPNEDDQDALEALLRQAVDWQNTDPNAPSVDEILADLARQGREITDVNRARGDYGGSGGGGGRGGFGGGGGGGQSVRLTDPTALAAMIDSIARQRMGRSLTPAEQQAFINYYHALEQQSAAAYYGGGTYTPPDVEGQAVAWIQNQFERESAAQGYGNMAAQFLALMGSSNPFGAMTS